MEDEALRTRGADKVRVRLGWSAWLGVGGLYLLGWVLAALGAAATLFLGFGPGLGAFLLFSLFTVVPAVAIWRMNRSRYWRSLAAGMTNSWAFMLWLVFVWHPWSTMSSGEVDQATAEIRGSGVPAFYLGDQAGRFDWNDYHLDDSQVNFFYGECRASDPEAGCTDWDIEVSNLRDTLAGDFIAGCERLDPILGAPAVTLGGFNIDRPGDNIGGFESTNVFIRFADDEIGLERKVALAETLRPIGADRATSLPTPSEARVADIERLCGPTP